MDLETLMKMIDEAVSKYKNHRTTAQLYFGAVDFETGKILNPSEINLKNIQWEDGVDQFLSLYTSVIRVKELCDVALTCAFDAEINLLEKIDGLMKAAEISERKYRYVIKKSLLHYSTHLVKQYERKNQEGEKSEEGNDE
ncbi:hypothetical protein J4456_02540 [Candidatus Pacearchaeota archaeon]|nr:hypothetical protein [Candidatus Pacearchaeota archaeon]